MPSEAFELRKLNYNRRHGKQTYDRRRAAGVCVRCGLRRPEMTATRCRICLDYERDYKRARKLSSYPAPFLPTKPVLKKLPKPSPPLSLPGAKGYLRGSIASGYEPGSIARSLLGIVRDPWVGR